MEINLASSEKSGEEEDRNAAAIPEEATGIFTSQSTGNFKSMEYIPGKGGSYADMSGRSHQAKDGNHDMESPTQNDSPPSNRRSGTSPLRLLIIIVISLLLAGAGIFLLSSLESGENQDFSLTELIAMLTGADDLTIASQQETDLQGHKGTGTLNYEHPGKGQMEYSPELQAGAPISQGEASGIIPKTPDAFALREAPYPADRPEMPPPTPSLNLPTPTPTPTPTLISGITLPYLYLMMTNQSNKPAPMPPDSSWSAQQKQTWRRGITHIFPWQRYKTIMEVRSRRLAQSQVILYDALNDNRFWIRMRAVMALADFGVSVSPGTVRKAIGVEEKSLVSRFFRRFYRKNTPGERYVMRMSLPLIKPSGRVTILRSLFAFGVRAENHGLYLAAALEDPDDKIRSFASLVANRESGSWLENQRRQFRAISAGPIPDINKTENLPASAPVALPEEQPPIELDRIEIFNTPEPPREALEEENYDVNLAPY